MCLLAHRAMIMMKQIKFTHLAFAVCGLSALLKLMKKLTLQMEELI